MDGRGFPLPFGVQPYFKPDQHIGTFGARDGGDMGVIAMNWLQWVTRRDRKAGQMFVGPGCGLCKDPSWHIARKKTT